MKGEFIPIDIGDASGMNLMNIKTKKFERKIISFFPDLEKKLGGDPMPSNTNYGLISEYF